MNLRGDDRGLLEELHEDFRLGALTDVPARANSKPQVRWSIVRKADCAQLVRILREHPIRGRKSLDFDLWAAAVDEWVGEGPTARPWMRDWTPMAQLAQQLKAVRAYVPRFGFTVHRDPGWKAFLAGFITAEGHLGVERRTGAHKWRARLAVRTRADELPLLQELRALSDAGTVNHCKPAGVNPVATWSVQSRNDLCRLVSLLNEAPLRGRKAKEYELWRRVAMSPSGAQDIGENVSARLKQLRHGYLT